MSIVRASGALIDRVSNVLDRWFGVAPKIVPDVPPAPEIVPQEPPAVRQRTVRSRPAKKPMATRRRKP